MTERQSRPSFARRIAAARTRRTKYCVWDEGISGLGVCIHPSGVRSFVLRRRLPDGRVRSVTLGRVGRMSVPEARHQARRTLAEWLEDPRPRRGPRYPGLPMTDFAEEFLERYSRHWKPGTLRSSAGVLRNHILPAFRHLSVDEITAAHVGEWFASLAERPGTANRAMPVLSVLSVMMRMAEQWGYRVHNTNPCRGTRRYRRPPMERYLTPKQMARLNAVLARDEFYRPQAVAAIRLMMLTGCRPGEILGLQWAWIRGPRIRLPDSKSGPRTVWLCSAAVAILEAILRYSGDCPFVFPARPPVRALPLAAIGREWPRIREEAGLEGLRLHDLRHTWASVAAMNGVDMVTVAKALGHALVETTERYTHLSEGSVAEAAERVSARIAAALAGEPAGGQGGSGHAHG